MYRHDEKGDLMCQIFLSYFSLAKLVKLAKPISKSTFDSISRPWDNPESVLEQVAKIKWDLPSLVQRYLPRVSTIPLHQGMCWEPTWKAIPNMAFFSDYMIRGAHVKREIGRQRSCFTVLPLEIMSFTSLMRFPMENSGLKACYGSRLLVLLLIKRTK
jgi:hypothetical protein